MMCLAGCLFFCLACCPASYRTGAEFLSFLYLPLYLVVDFVKFEALILYTCLFKMSFFKKLTKEFESLKASLEDKPKKEEAKPVEAKPVEQHGNSLFRSSP